MQVIQLSVMLASRGTFQDPRAKESPASRIQRHPEVQLNGLTQQLAFLSRDFSKYLIAARYLVLNARTHTEAGRIRGFYHHNSNCLRTGDVYTSAYILVQLTEVQLNSMQDVAQAERGQERMDALQEACGRVTSSIFQLEKLAHHFHPLNE